MKAQNDFTDIFKFTSGPKLAKAFLRLRDSVNGGEDKNMVMYHTKKNLKRKNKLIATIYVRMYAGFLDLIKILRAFYQYKTPNKLFPYLLILSIFDVASLKANPDWSKDQKKAYKEANKFASEFEQALVLVAAKDVLNEQPPESKLTVHQLANKIKKKLKDLKDG